MEEQLIEVITEYNKADFKKSINDFIKENKIKDIKYSTNTYETYEWDGTKNTNLIYTAFIEY